MPIVVVVHDGKGRWEVHWIQISTDGLMSGSLCNLYSINTMQSTVRSTSHHHITTRYALFYLACMIVIGVMAWSILREIVHKL